MEDKLFLVMPAYNEAANISDVVRQWYPIIEKIGHGSKLIVFDDGSKDNTYSIMKDLQTKYPDFIAETKPNSGHGSTCLYAYHYSLSHGADYVFQTDSDGQTDPEEFWRFWDEREHFDIGIGIRNKRKDGFSRIVVTKVLKVVVRLMFGVKVNDANTPFRLIRKDKLIEYLDIIPADFFLSNVVMSVIAVKLNDKIFWTNVTFKPRQGGVNSINLKKIFGIGIKALCDFRKINKKINSYEK